MQAGAHNGISKTNIVLRAPQDLSFSLQVKRERMLQKQFTVIGRIESIVFEGNDSNFTGTRADMRITGRRLYWPQDGPYIARSRPEEDLIFAQHIRLPLPMIPDASDDRPRNPYQVDRFGKRHLAEGETPQGARLIKQRLEDVAGGVYKNFLIFQPVAQIVCLMLGKDKDGEAVQWGTLGTHRIPLSSLSSADGRKMALLIDPYTGEAYFTGGRYSVDVKHDPMMTREQMMDAHASMSRSV